MEATSKLEFVLKLDYEELEDLINFIDIGISKNGGTHNPRIVQMREQMADLHDDFT